MFGNEHYPTNITQHYTFLVIRTTARATNVPPDLGEFVCLCRTVLRAHLRHAGVVFSRSSTNVGNSQIMFYPSGDQSLQAVPGLIKYIFEGDDGSMAFAVQ